MHRLLVAALVAAPLAAAPLHAQGAPARANADPDRNAAGGLHVPGWTAHFDRPSARPDQVRFVRMGGGLHVTAGPAAIYFDPSRTASGTYAVSATFTQTKAPTHPEAYGLFVGGQHLQSDSASYLYFIIRGDGKYMVRHRTDANTVHTLIDWTASPAVHQQDAAGKATNALQVRVGADSVRFFANRQQVASLARSAVGSVDGVAGIRVNHNLDVHVSNFAVTKP